MKIEIVVNRLKDQGLHIAVAESCTGGLLSSAITSVPGSSACFGYGIVTYSNQAKHEILGVPWEVLNEFGAVSYQTAYWMAIGVQRIAKSQLGLSITGIAGPSGGSAEKPVGLVYIALARGECCEAHKFHFTGTREAIRKSTVDKAIDLLLQHV